jgi:hypothetical protein
LPARHGECIDITFGIDCDDIHRVSTFMCVCVCVCVCVCGVCVYVYIYAWVYYMLRYVCVRGKGREWTGPTKIFELCEGVLPVLSDLCSASVPPQPREVHVHTRCWVQACVVLARHRPHIIIWMVVATRSSPVKCENFFPDWLLVPDRHGVVELSR